MRWRWIGVVSILFLAVVGGYWYIFQPHSAGTISPIGQIFEKPLERYTIDRLATRAPQGGDIIFDEAIATTSAYTVYAFHYPSEGKKITGLAHVPIGASESSKKPVIVQLRGYVEQE